MADTQGRTQFLARVASNSLEIVQREMVLGRVAAEAEVERLRVLCGSKETQLQGLRWQLVHGLRDGSVALDFPGLADHLRGAIVNQINIDQPRYPGLATALRGGSGV